MGVICEREKEAKGDEERRGRRGGRCEKRKRRGDGREETDDDDWDPIGGGELKEMKDGRKGWEEEGRRGDRYVSGPGGEDWEIGRAHV